MFELADERRALFQWDLNRKVTVEDETITVVHFANQYSKEALVVEVHDGEANIPNILLTENAKFIFVYGVNVNFTKYFEKFPVIPRPIPSDYVYEETEVKTLDELGARVKTLEEKINTEILTRLIAIDDKATTIDRKVSNLPDYSVRFNNLDEAISALPNYSTRFDTLEAAVAALPNYTTRFNAIDAAISALPNYETRFNAIDNSLAEIVNLIGEVENGAY